MLLPPHTKNTDTDKKSGGGQSHSTANNRLLSYKCHHFAVDTELQKRKVSFPSSFIHSMFRRV